MKPSSLALGTVLVLGISSANADDRSGFSKLKVRQRSKIAEVRVALVEAGLVALDEQAATLGLSRSTAWSILKPGHKSSGLSARTISRILRSTRLPGRVRETILEYMQEKIKGLYGHTERRRREFGECLMAELRNEIKYASSPTEFEQQMRSTTGAHRGP